MSTTTTYTCDRCGKNVATKGQLRYFTAKVDFDVDRKGASAQGMDDVEVCQPCAGVLMAAVQSTMKTAVPDNPAVMAVAAAPCLIRHSRSTLSTLPLNRAVVDCTLDIGKHPQCALAALASSQEVREWLVSEADQAVYDSGTVDGQVDYIVAAKAATDAILNAMGGWGGLT